MINRSIGNGNRFMLIMTGEAERGNAGEQPFEE
jgi:hypothetical protein